MDSNHAGHRLRMKEKFLTAGLDALHDHEVLEMLLFSAIPRQDTNLLAHQLIKKYGSLNDVLNQNYDELLGNKGIGPVAAFQLSLLAPFSRRYLRGTIGHNPKLNSVEISGQYVLSLLNGLTHEHFYMICLDNRCRLQRSILLSQGTVSEASIYPRTVVENAIRHNASFVILAHNHPSGSIHPSRQDIEATQMVLQALRPIGIDLIDHIIVAGDKLYSFARQGMISVSEAGAAEAKYAAEDAETVQSDPGEEAK